MPCGRRVSHGNVRLRTPVPSQGACQERSLSPLARPPRPSGPLGMARKGSVPMPCAKPPSRPSGVKSLKTGGPRSRACQDGLQAHCGGWRRIGGHARRDRISKGSALRPACLPEEACLPVGGRPWQRRRNPGCAHGHCGPGPAGALLGPESDAFWNYACPARAGR